MHTLVTEKEMSKKLHHFLAELEPIAKTQYIGARNMSNANQISEVELEKETVTTWEEIERAESYLVSCMFVEAESLASSIIKKLCHSCIESNDELHDMLEAAGMVVVQSLKEDGRTLEILNDLKSLYGSVTSTPQVFLTGVCLQMCEDPSLDVQKYLEEYLQKFTYKDGSYIVVEANECDIEESNKKIALSVDQFLEFVELYVITFLGVLRQDVDLAVSWVEKATLPEEKRQELLRRLRSMNPVAATSSLQSSDSSLNKHENGVDPTYTGEHITQSRLLNDPESEQSSSHKQSSAKETILKLSKQKAPFWCFNSITLKFGKNKVIVSNTKILMGCFLMVLCYFMQRKRASLQRVVKKQAEWIKKGIVDLWQLAFSYQVNPLAAVQPISAATSGSR